MRQYEYDDNDDIVVPHPTKDEDIVFHGGVYDPVTRAVGTQQEVADRWAAGELPVHEVHGRGDACGVLRTSTGNYEAYQYPDGTGRTKHYGVTNAIRTQHGLVLHNPNDYARGWALLTYPSRSAHSGETYTLPIDQMGALERKGVPSRYDVFDVVKGDTTDDDGYDHLVVYETDDGTKHYYRAKRNGFNETPLDSQRDVDAFLNAIHA